MIRTIVRSRANCAPAAPIDRVPRRVRQRLERDRSAASSQGGFGRRVGLWLVLVAAACSSCTRFDPAASTSIRPLPLPTQTRSEIARADLRLHVDALTDPRTAGRLAGSAGERIAADYLVGVLRAIGLRPGGPDDRFRQSFPFTSGVSFGTANAAVIESGDEDPVALALDRDWRPLAFSRSGVVDARPVVVAGYGLVVPDPEQGPPIDDYRGADVTDRWVLVFRDLPTSLAPERRQALQRHASLRYKAMVARDRGAHGILFVSGPEGRFREELVPLRFDASLAGTRLAAISISDDTATRLLARTGRDVAAWQRIATASLDAAPHSIAPATPANGGGAHAQASIPMALPADLRLRGQIELVTERSQGHNVLARLQVGPEPSTESIVLGAHFDHLGRGEGAGSLARGAERDAIHPGADDNASGTALLLEIAEALEHARRRGADLGRRDFLFAAWSGEELGLLGSHAWIEAAVPIDPQKTPATPTPIAYLNFDMVGRLDERLIVQGLGSSDDWAPLLDGLSKRHAIELRRQQDSHLPTDATSFYTRGIPILSAFTGVHAEYHTPRDTPDRLAWEGLRQIGTLFADLAVALSRAPSGPEYRAQPTPRSGAGLGGFRVYLGTIPDYAQAARETPESGVALAGVTPAGPAAQAGLRAGDVIVSVDGRAIENLYDYTFALQALRIGEVARIGVRRGDDRLVFEVTPASRD